MRTLFNSVATVATHGTKGEVSFVAGITLGPLLPIVEKVVEKYLFQDWQFAGFLMVLIFVDTVVAVLRAWQVHNLSSRAFSRLFLKASIYLALLILSHVMTHFPVHGEPNVLFQYFDYFIYCSMMAREALSILENLAAVDKTLVPAWVVRRLAQFNAEGPKMAAPASLLSTPAVAEAEPIPSSPTTTDSV